jgi:hypothetical protein
MNASKFTKQDLFPSLVVSSLLQTTIRQLFVGWIFRLKQH